MQRKICPICDHEIKHGKYCSFCRQWVSRPNIINATYYLNERHPANETGCEYHTSPVRQNPTGRTGASARPNIPSAASSAGRTRQTKPSGYSTGSKSAAEAQRKNQSRTGKLIMMVFTIIFIWIFVTGILPVLFFFL